MQVGDAVASHLQAAVVDVKPYEAFVGDVEAAVRAGLKLWADASKVRLPVCGAGSCGRQVPCGRCSAGRAQRSVLPPRSSECSFHQCRPGQHHEPSGCVCFAQPYLVREHSGETAATKGRHNAQEHPQPAGGARLRGTTRSCCCSSMAAAASLHERLKTLPSTGQHHASPTVPDVSAARGIHA